MVLAYCFRMNQIQFSKHSFLFLILFVMAYILAHQNYAVNIEDLIFSDLIYSFDRSRSSFN